MSVLKSLYGINRIIPETDETGWGAEATLLLDDLIDVVDSTTSLLSNGNGVPKSEGTSTALAADATLTQTHTQHKISGSGGAVTLSATTAIADGSVDGQKLELVGNHATNTVTIRNGANTVLNGHCVLGQHEKLILRWDSTASDWIEEMRST